MSLHVSLPGLLHSGVHLEFIVLSLGLIGPWVKPKVGASGLWKGLRMSPNAVVGWGVSEWHYKFGLGLLCPGFLPPVLPIVLRKEDLAWGALSPSRQLPWGAVQAERRLRSLCPAAVPAGFCAVLSSDCLCASLLVLLSFLPLRFLQLPVGYIACFHCCLARTPFSFLPQEASVCPGRCWGQWGHEVFWGG